jgi:hypothetical protein
MDILSLDSLYQAQLRNKASDILDEKHICKFLIQSYLLPLNLMYKSNNYFPPHLSLLFCVLTLQVLIEVLVLPPNLVPHLLQVFDDVLILTIFLIKFPTISSSQPPIIFVFSLLLALKTIVHFLLEFV